MCVCVSFSKLLSWDLGKARGPYFGVVGRRLRQARQVRHARLALFYSKTPVIFMIPAIRDCRL